MKLFLFITMSLIGYISFSQQSNPSPALTKEEYLKKSKNENTTAWILASGGLVMSTVTLAIAANEDGEGSTNFLTTVIDLATNTDSNPDDKTSLTGIFFYVGAACIITQRSPVHFSIKKQTESNEYIFQ